MRGGEGEEDNGDIYEVSQPQSLTREAPCKVAVGAKLSDRVATQQSEKNDNRTEGWGIRENTLGLELFYFTARKNICIL